MPAHVGEPSNDDQKSLWETGFFRIPPSQQATASQLRATLRTCPDALGPYLADVCAGSRGKFRKPNVAAVEAHLLKALKKKDVLPALRVLNSAIFNLNRRYQKNIPRPTRYDRLTKDPNLLPENFSDVQRRVDAWEQAEKRWVEQNSRFADPGCAAAPVAWEMVVASAGLRSGLLSVKRAVAFARALADPHQHFGRSPIRGYADLAVVVSGIHEEVVRWYPNNQLLLLISRVSSVQVKNAVTRCSRNDSSPTTRDRRLAQVIFVGIVAELKRQSVDPTLLPKSLHDFVKTISQSLRKELPGELNDYASGVVRGPSLLPGSASRVNNEPTVYSLKISPTPNARLSEELPDQPEAYAQDPRKQEPKWMHSLRAAVSETDILLSTRALSAIERDDETSPSGRQLCTLAKKLLTGTAYPDASWSHASIRCCILTVARRFAIQRKNEDPSTYSATTWVELCKLSIDEAAEDSASPQGLQKTVRWALLQYHRHLVDDCEAVPFDERAVLRVLPGSDPADAHVLTIDEIFQVIEHIQFSRNRKWKELHRIVAVGQAVLDFLGGLRRAEGLGLLPTDLLPGSFCEVKVSDNDIRALKTDNAYRRVRLGPMAHPFPELLDPVHVLFQEAKRLGTDLSCGLSDDTIVPIIHEALQAVTGSDDCHLHTFRHSAAHWMYMRLMIADLDQAAAKLFPHWPKTTIWLQASRDLRCLLLHNNDSVNDTGWAVCATLGHSNPDTVTLRYYVHCLDLLLAFFLEARTKLGAPATREAIRGLSGLPLSTAYSQLPASTDNVNRNVSVDGLQEADGARPMTEGEFALQIFSYRLGLSIPSSCHALSPPVDSPFWPKDTYDILWMSMELGLTSERLATIFGLNEQCIGAILSRADSVLRTHGFQRSPNRVLGNQKVRDEAQTRTVKVPKPPRIGFDSDAFREWSAKIGDHVGGNQKGMAALSHMATNMVPATAQVVFARVQQPELMQACLRVFEALGFGCNDLHAVSCDETEQANPSRKWLRERGISWRITATNQFGRSRLLKVPPPWVVVGPKPPLDATARLEAEAVWFLVRMGAIWFSL